MADGMAEVTGQLAEQYGRTAQFYTNHAKRFEPGTLGYAGNMAEAAKYAGMAERASRASKNLGRVVAALRSGELAIEEGDRG